MNGTQTNFVSSLSAAVRENPFAAGLIGGGALMLLIGSERLKNVVSAAPAAAAPAADIGASGFRSAASKVRGAARDVTSQLGQAGQGLGDTLRNAGSAASEAMSEAAGQIGDRLDQGMGYARENVSRMTDVLPDKETLRQAQSSLTDLLERQPLVLGAVGLAIGAAVAGAFRPSDLENELVGELSDSVRTDLSRRAGAVKQSLREASDTMVAEVEDASAESIDRLQQAGRDAMNAARGSIKPASDAATTQSGSPPPFAGNSNAEI